MRLSWLVAQIIIVRPLLMFTAAVLWTNGSYIPGNVSHVFLLILFLLPLLLFPKGHLSEDLEWNSMAAHMIHGSRLAEYMEPKSTA